MRNLPDLTVPVVDEKTNRSLDFVKTELARRLMFYTGVQEYAASIDEIKPAVDSNGRYSVDLSSLFPLPNNLTPGIALRLGLALIVAGVDAVDANASKLLESLSKK